MNESKKRGVLIKVKNYFGSLYGKKLILCLNRYAQFIIDSSLSDARTVPSESMVHLFLCRKRMFPRMFYHIFHNTSSSGKILASESAFFISPDENKLMSQSHGSLLLSNNIWLVSNTLIVSNICIVNNKCLVVNFWFCLTFT